MFIKVKIKLCLIKQQILFVLILVNITLNIIKKDKYINSQISYFCSYLNNKNQEQKRK